MSFVRRQGTVMERVSANAVNRCLKLVLIQATISSWAFAQDYSQGSAIRETYRLAGLGIVGREIAGETSCGGGGSGNLRISLLASLDGSTVAELEQRRDQYGSCQVFLLEGTERERLWRGWDLPEISYESVGLVYFEERDGFARVLEHTVPPGLWVRVADVPDGRLHPWPELLVERQRLYVGYDGHELRYEPSEFSAVIVSLRDRQAHETEVHQLTPTGSLSEDWGEFEVIEFDGDFYALTQMRAVYPTGNRWKGWLRLVNSKGLPEFWFFTRD
jgi:hypothetical protein